MRINSGIYKITHRESGKVYIGQSTNLKRRYNGYKNSGGSGNGNSVIKRSILKYGWDAFDWEIVLYSNDMNYLNEMEIRLISFHNCLVPKGLNVESGGTNAPFPEHLKKLFSEQRKGKKHTIEARNNMSVGQKKRWENISVEEYKRLSELGRKNNIGKIISDETKLKLSNTRKKLIADGLIKCDNFKGKSHTEETKKKMSQSHKGRKISEESRQRCREAAIKRWQNPEYRQKQKMSNVGVK